MPLSTRCCRRTFGVAAVTAVAFSLPDPSAALGASELVPRLHAATPAVTGDSDGDGLSNTLELVLGFDPDLVDTDGDEYLDAEEFARGSDAKSATSIPGGTAIKIGMAAFELADRVHCPTAIYFPSGDVRTGEFGLALLAGFSIVPMPLSGFRGGHPVRVVPALDGIASIAIVDPTVERDLVLTLGSYSMAATLASDGHYVAAGAVNLEVVDGQIFQHVITGYRGDWVSSTQVGAGVGGVYRPLTPGGGGTGSIWTPGQICAQTTVVVGVIGAVITQEIVSADCVDGWDAYCSSGCAASVGSTLKVIDPAALVGG